MKFAEGGYIFSSGIRLDTKPHFAQCIYTCMTKEQAKILGFDIGVGMSEIKARKLAIGRSNPTGRLILCDEQTGQPLEGQTDLKINSPGDGFPTITVTFDVWGTHGVRFMGEAEEKQ